jgi:uroporphyrinogen III methyltransferase/synthase
MSEPRADDPGMSEPGAGRVYFVGAGPGDPGLMTARALELIASADVILYDRLIPVGAVGGARSDAELRYVGKEGGGPSADQDEIEALMLTHARAGRNVVRLKGGDPFVFGRGGEEALALAAAGIAFEVVPGVTAGIAAAAYAGIPVTQRGLASAVALVTAHEDPTKDDQALDWDALAAFPGTLVFYMGVRQLERLSARLIAAGRAASEPVAIVERGTLPEQRASPATLASLAQVAESRGVRAPAVVIVGEVVQLSEQLAWFEHGVLAGRTVVVTRARAQASSLSGRLRALGARVVEAPAIRVVPRAIELPELTQFDLLCLTSANGVELLFERMRERDLDARALAGLRVAAIGPGTATALRDHGIAADVVPERFVAEGLLEALAEGELPRRVLVARAADARDELIEGLRALGAAVEVLALYDTVAEPIDAGASEALADADYVTFTSASTVRFLLSQATPGPRTRLVSIGPVTSEALRERRLEPHVEARRHDIPGLIDALVADATRSGA